MVKLLIPDYAMHNSSKCIVPKYKYFHFMLPSNIQDVKLLLQMVLTGYLKKKSNDQVNPAPNFNNAMVHSNMLCCLTMVTTAQQKRC